MPGDDLQPEELSPIGFGCYRVDIRDPINRAALELALASGCNLIDTASNYSDGLAEELVGSVLTASGAPAFVITKVGYVSPAAARWLKSRGRDPEGLHDLSEHSKYSIDPDVIHLLIELSRARLGRDVLDVVLLHNPEHLTDLGMSDEEAGAAIQNAFAALHQEVDSGRLRFCGVSSNVMATAEPGAPYNFETFTATARLGRPSEEAMFIEFPLNFLERAAATTGDRPSLLSRSAGQALRIANRPLNAQLADDVARLATSVNPDVESVWNDCISLVDRQLAQEGVDHAWADFRPMQFLRDNRAGIGDFDMIDAIWRAQVEPFIMTLFGPDPSPEVRVAFQGMRHGIGQARRRVIEQRGIEAVRSLADRGLIEVGANESLARAACRYALKAGADHVVTGMRTPAYVRELLPLFSERRAGPH